MIKTFADKETQQVFVICGAFVSGSWMAMRLTLKLPIIIKEQHNGDTEHSKKRDPPDTPWRNDKGRFHAGLWFDYRIIGGCFGGLPSNDQ